MIFGSNIIKINENQISWLMISVGMLLNLVIITLLNLIMTIVLNLIMITLLNLLILMSLHVLYHIDM